MNDERRRWEYRTLAPPREATMKEAKDPEDALADLGEDGWKLVDTIDYVGGGTKYLVLVRPAGRGGREAPGEGDGRPDGTGANEEEPDEDQEPTADHE